jgi:hypothetical protein
MPLSSRTYLTPRPATFMLGPFGGTNFAAGVTAGNTVSIAALGAGASHYLMPFYDNTTLLGYRAAFTALASHVGTLTLLFYVNGSNNASYSILFDPTTADDQTLSADYTTPLNLVPGDTLQIKGTTSGDWSATGCDLVMYLKAMHR